VGPLFLLAVDLGETDIHGGCCRSTLVHVIAMVSSSNDQDSCKRYMCRYGLQLGLLQLLLLQRQWSLSRSSCSNRQCLCNTGRSAMAGLPETQHPATVREAVLLVWPQHRSFAEGQGSQTVKQHGLPAAWLGWQLRPSAAMNPIQSFISSTRDIIHSVFHRMRRPAATVLPADHPRSCGCRQRTACEQTWPCNTTITLRAATGVEGAWELRYACLTGSLLLQSPSHPLNPVRF
jgi:hypothetical protein